MLSTRFCFTFTHGKLGSYGNFWHTRPMFLVV